MATRKRVIQRLPTETLMPAVREYLLNRSMRERSEYHEGSIKAQLMVLLEKFGEHVPGKWTFVFDQPVEYLQVKGGKPVEKAIAGIERRERRSQVMSQERTMELLEAKDLVRQCTDVIVVVNEDAVLAANYSGQIDDKELASLYDESSTYAFHLLEGNP